MNNESQVTDIAAEQLLIDLVVIPSLSREERAAVEYMVGWMAAHGYDDAYIDEAGNAVGIIGKGARTLVLLGHIDTFPGNPPVRQCGRLLYGRGAVDAKGPLCAFAAAAARIDLHSDFRIVVVGAVEEEAATSRGARYVATQFQPEACIIGEPSNWDRITLGYKGRLLVDWSWKGPLAHSAGPVLSPAEQALGYWRAVETLAERFNEGEDRLFYRLDASLRDINTVAEGTHGCAQMTLGFRLPPQLAPDELAAQLETLVEQGGIQPSPELRIYGAEPAFAADKDNPLTRVLRGAVRDAGGKPRFVHKTGTADMNVVGPIWNCPIVAYGPGDSRLDHTPDEHIDLDEYLCSIKILTRALSELTSALSD